MSLKKIFGSKLRADILLEVFSNPEQDYHVRKLAAIVNGHSTNVSRELRMLEEVGILVHRKVGRKVIVSLKKDDPSIELFGRWIQEWKNPISRIKRYASKNNLSLRSVDRQDETGDSVLVILEGNDTPSDLEDYVDMINSDKQKPFLKALYVWVPSKS